MKLTKNKRKRHTRRGRGEAVRRGEGGGKSSAYSDPNSVSVGSFSIDDGDGSENVTFKMN